MMIMLRWADRRYHRDKHTRHAITYVWYVILGGLFVLAIIICLCGGVLA